MRLSSLRIIAGFVLAIMLVAAVQNMGRHPGATSLTTHHAPSAVRGHHTT